MNRYILAVVLIAMISKSFTVAEMVMPPVRLQFDMNTLVKLFNRGD